MFVEIEKVAGLMYRSIRTSILPAVMGIVFASAGPLSAANPSAAPDSAATPAPLRAGNAEVEKVIREFQGKGQIGDETQPLSPEETLKHFKLDQGLKIELVAAEPAVMQPLYLSFDARGRMWVTQYRQYPFPAGLKIVRYDQYLRAVFDNVPLPPPRHVPGEDRVTMFEDTDGDGKYDRSRDVIAGLNIATAALTGRGGIWVMNTPYLLFYPDANGDDIPDGDPEVRLRGFGMEDTHAVANSLAWGPDGWLYGAMGSTTTANVSSRVTKDVKFEGQCTWRYHPDTDIFEVFAEGGGNTFSLEFDSAGRLFSGTNHGDTRGMYYPQGSYGEKNFGKHGPLTNPYAFGYFHHMAHQGDRDRFPQTFVIYEGGSLPERFQGKIIAANALHHRVWGSEMQPDGSTYKTVDIPTLCQTDDTWFRPVDVKTGPDGAVYLADWYDNRLSHVDPKDTWHKTSGRIYRLQNEQAVAQPFTNFLTLSNEQLMEHFTHPNKWQRQTAVRILADRLRGTGDSPAQQQLRTLLSANSPGTLEALWTLASAQLLSESDLAAFLKHPQEHVRRWSVRLLGDSRTVQPATAQQLAALAKSETKIQVRSQLASTAKRLKTSATLPILAALLEHDEDATDKHLPLQIWWGFESHCGEHEQNSDPQMGVRLTIADDIPPRQQVIRLFQDEKLWNHPITRQAIASRLMRRFALEGVQDASNENATALNACDQLLHTAPAEVRPILMAGFLEAYEGKEIAALPAGLKQSIQEYQKSLGELDLVLGVRLGQAEAVKKALQEMQNESADPATRLALINTFAQVDQPQAVPTLLALLRSPSNGIKKAALLALMRYSDARIGQQICALFQSSLADEHGLRAAAFRVLASRRDWTDQLLKEFESRQLNAASVPNDIVQQLRLHPDAALQKRIEHLWGHTRETTAEKAAEMDRVRKLLTGAVPVGTNIQLGKQLFTKHCANCHTLFNEGGQIGPNLTGYERSNLNFMLLAVVDPSAGIREEFTQFQVATEDGRILTGLMIDQTPTSVTIRGANNQTTVISRDNIEELKAMTISLMPDGVLKDLSDAEIVSLFQYVMQPTPAAITGAK